MDTVAIPRAAKKLAKAVLLLPQRFQNPPKALLVGGFVRDSILKLQPKDIDMEVYGVSYEMLNNALEKLFPNQIIEVGKSFGVFKIRQQNFEIDIALPRTESKTGTGHKAFATKSNPDITVTEALSRRDFTINTIALDPLTKEYIDPYNGQKDIADRILRVVNPQKFIEDPLRVYRALQLVGRFNLTVEPGTLELLKRMVSSGELGTLSKERITEEWRKLLLKSKRPSLGFTLAMDLGIIEKYFPELYILKSTPQEPEWHPEGNVWNHSLLSLDVAAAKLVHKNNYQLTETEQLAALLGALLHDIGKANTTKKQEGRIRSRGHEETGKKLSKIFLSKHTFGRNIDQAVSHVAAEHMKPRQLFSSLQNKEMTTSQYTNALRRLLKRIYPTSWKVIILASEADLKGRGKNDLHNPFPAGEQFAKIIMEQKLEQSVRQTLITGQDILDTAKKLNIPITPGPKFKAIIQKIEHKRDENAITTRKEALKLLQKLL